MTTAEIEGIQTLNNVLSTLQSFDDPSPQIAALRKTFENLKSDRTPLLAEEPVGSVKSTKLKRELRYKAASKDISKWIPQIRRNQTSEQLTFGAAPATTVPSAEELASSFEPAEGFETELATAIVDSGICDEIKTDEIEENGTYGFGNITSQNQHPAGREKLARLKQLMLWEHIRSKRQNRIKSKTWRRDKRRTDAKEKEKLLARLDTENPELASQIRNQLETTRAKDRLLRADAARKKWAQLASRFGGKELQTTIARQHQTAHDEKRAVERLAKKRGTGFVADDESSDDETTNQAEATTDEGMGDFTAHGVKRGVMALPFMQRAAEERRKKEKEMRIRRETRRSSDDDDSADERARNNDAQSDKDGRKSRLEDDSNPSRVESARKSVRDRAGIREDAVAEAAKTLEHPSAETEIYRFTPSSNPWITAGTMVSSASGVVELGEGEMPVEDRLSKQNDRSSAVASLDSLCEAFDVQETSEQKELIRETFVMGTQEEDFFAAQEESEAEEQTSAKRSADPSDMPGWGSWAGAGIKPSANKRKNKRNGQEHEESDMPPPSKMAKKGSQEERRRCVVRHESDRKQLAKYLVSEVPYPYRDAAQYELMTRQPIGHDWNTTAVHNRFIQPKINIRMGAVLPPLQYAKVLPPEQIDSLLEAWDGRKKPYRSKAKF